MFVVGIWLLFAFLYLILGWYDKIHHMDMASRCKESGLSKESGLPNYAVFSFVWAVWAVSHTLSTAPNDQVRHGNMVADPEWQWYVICLGLALLCAGLGFVVWGRLYLNGLWANKIYDYRELADSTDMLVTAGAYNLIRHPIYVGQAGLFFGTGLALNSWSYLLPALLPTGYNVIRARREEERLKEFFGPKWGAYCERSGRFCPKIRKLL